MVIAGRAAGDVIGMVAGYELGDTTKPQYRSPCVTDYEVRESVDSPITLYRRGASFGPLEPAHFDFDLRVKNMKAAGVDLAVITMSAPSAFWGDEAVSTEAARIANDEFRAAATAHPDHIRWMATLPWEYPAAAVAELERACGLGAAAHGAVGVLVLGNINGRHLTDPLFEPIWRVIDARALPVLVHPTVPPGAGELDLARYALVGSIGFMVAGRYRASPSPPRAAPRPASAGSNRPG